MDKRVMLFSHPLCQKGATMTPKEIDGRCRQIKLEVITLAPALTRLKSSGLEYAIADHDGLLTAEFYLVPHCQARLPFKVLGRPQPMSEFMAVECERRMIIDSLAETATQMTLIALNIASPGLSSGKPDQSEWRLRNLMKRFRGKSYALHHLGENLEIQFPEIPGEVVSPAISRLRCRIHSVTPGGAEIVCLGLESTDGSTPLIGRSRRYWLNYSPGGHVIQIAMEHLRAAFQKQTLSINVHLVHEPLMNQIVRFQMA